MAENGFRTYLRDVIGIADVPGGNPTARRIAIQDEGLTTIDDLVDFDDDEIKILCQSVRKPGGSIVDPNDATRTRTIPDPGFKIPSVCEKRLKLAANGARLYAKINRPITADALSRSRLKLIDKHLMLIDEHEDPDTLPQISKTFGIMRAMDLVPSHLRECLGVNKVPLSYVIRDQVIPTQLGQLLPNQIHSADFESFVDELIVHTAHNGPEFVEDNARVFSILMEMVRGTSFESSLKSHQRARDGRNAYLSLLQHNMGSSKWDKVIEEAETYVLRREWNGKNYRFTLKNHITKHREAHNELTRASQFVDYEIPNEHTRVSRLLKSLTTKDPAIISAITHIQGDQNQRNDFEAAADFLLLTAPSSNVQSNSHRVSAVRKGGKFKSKGTGDTGVEFRYYTGKEYKSLSKAQKKELSEWRERNKENNTQQSNGETNRISVLESTLIELKKSNDEIKSKISALTINSTQPRDPLQNPLTQRND